MMQPSQPLPSSVLKYCCYCNVLPNRSCVPILKLLASAIAERSSGPKYFQCSLAQTPATASFCPKSCFLVSYSPSPTCIPNLKLLASTVAEINRGSQIFWMLPQPGPPPILVVKVVSWQVLPHAQVVYQIEVASFNGCRKNRGVPIFLGCSPSLAPCQF